MSASRNALVLAALLLSQSGWGAAVSQQVDRGNVLYAEKKYSEALESYNRAAADVPEDLRVSYNQACAHYEMKHYDEAAKKFRRVDAGTKDLKLAAAARYNLGNCEFRRGLEQKDSDLNKALEHLQRSAGFYQRALELNPDDRDAAGNIETVRLMIKDMMDQLKKQQEKQKEQQEQQEKLIEKLKELLERQQNAESASRELAGRPEQPDAKKKTESAQSEQKKITEETQETAKKLQQSPPPQPQAGQQAGQTSPHRQATEDLQKAQVEQHRAQKRLDGRGFQGAADRQRQAATHIAEALSRFAGPQQQPQQQQSEQDQKDGQEQEQQQDQGKKEKQKKSDATAAQILDKEQRDRKEREKRRRAAMSGASPVDKDW